MGNTSGGQSRGFTYSGTLQASIFWDLHKLLGIPGLSFEVGGAWSTGKNLSADYIGNSFTVQSAYTAPDNGTNNLTLGEMYLRQRLFNNSLVIAAGRLAPGSTFAIMVIAVVRDVTAPKQATESARKTNEELMGLVAELQRRESEMQALISMKITDAKLAATEFDFVSSLMPDYIAPTLEGTKLILENFGKEYPDAPKRDPKEFVDGSIMDRLKNERFVEGLKY